MINTDSPKSNTLKKPWHKTIIWAIINILGMITILPAVFENFDTLCHRVLVKPPYNHQQQQLVEAFAKEKGYLPHVNQNVCHFTIPDEWNISIISAAVFYLLAVIAFVLSFFYIFALRSKQLSRNWTKVICIALGLNILGVLVLLFLNVIIQKPGGEIYLN